VYNVSAGPWARPAVVTRSSPLDGMSDRRW
jgi:hypothetical protein